MIISSPEIENNNRGLICLISTITVVCTTVMVFFEPYSSSVFGYNHYDFQWWQLLTAHFVHYDWQHLVSNMLALGLLLYLFPASIGLILKGFLVAIVLIDTFLLLSDVTFYVGFSGLLYVIIGLAMGRMLQIKQTIRFVCLLVGVYFYMFHISEQLHNSKDVIWNSLKQAHMLGIFAGLCIMLLNICSERKVLNRQLRRIDKIIDHN